MEASDPWSKVKEGLSQLKQKAQLLLSQSMALSPEADIGPELIASPPIEVS